jgi:hypothetical protein
VDFADLVTPIASTDWNEGKLGTDQSTLDGNLDFLGKFDAETDVSTVITSNNDGLETGSLTSLGLLLNGDDLHDLITELLVGCLDEMVDNGGFLDWN